MREICSACKQHEAYYHLTEVSSRGGERLPICHLCVQAKGLNAGSVQDGILDTREIWSTIIADLARERLSTGGELHRCPDCNTSQRDFEGSGELGCPACYRTFKGELGRILTDFNGTGQHDGKIPYRIGRQLDLNQRLHYLQESIQRAVHEERFEEAARLRDEMQDLGADIRESPEEGS